MMEEDECPDSRAAFNAFPVNGSCDARCLDR